MRPARFKKTNSPVGNKIHWWHDVPLSQDDFRLLLAWGPSPLLEEAPQVLAFSGPCFVKRTKSRETRSKAELIALADNLAPFVKHERNLIGRLVWRAFVRVGSSSVLRCSIWEMYSIIAREISRTVHSYAHWAVIFSPIMLDIYSEKKALKSKFAWDLQEIDEEMGRKSFHYWLRNLSQWTLPQKYSVNFVQIFINYLIEFHFHFQKPTFLFSDFIWKVNPCV
jgi:hypothetical protein